MTRYLLLALSLALSACAESDDAALAPIEENEGYNKIDPVEAAVPGERELSLGEWSAGTQDERPTLQFGPAGTQPLFSLRCDDREGLLLQRHGVVPSEDAEMMTVTLGMTSRRLAVNPVAGTVPLLRAAVAASDDLMTQLSEAAGPIRIEVGDGPALNLPSSPMIEDYIRGCSADAPAAAPETNAAEPAEPQP